ncbi:MAG TPA: FAD-binding oxidoreductase [Candidatus Competibacteraceae bacterium]|nr:FAD-binding oxidoreductase [Candidatus Competibacteraceae bacterium]
MNPIQDHRLAALQALLPGLRLATDADTLTRYGQDWTRLHTPAPLAVAFPAAIEEVQGIVRWANESRTALVPSGGRTGLSGAAVAAHGELVVSFDRMNRILGFDPIDRTLTVQPGVITEVLQNHARELGLYYPVDFASRGSSQIGGNIATNAGGIKVIRYGLTRDWITGLKVVTGKGELLELNKGLIKNASGYDLRHLFIGSEGTLGLIVEATVKLTRAPRELSVMVLGVSSLDGIMEIFSVFQNRLELTAFEFFSEQALQHVLAKGLHKPFAADCPYYVLIEFENTAEEVMNAALAAFEYCAEQGWLVDGVVSQSETQAKELWRLREDITESIAPYLPYKNDISLRIARVPDFLREMDALFAREYPHFEVIWFGHIGDGNLHISVLKPADMEKSAFVAECGRVSELLFATLQRFGGSISAEHGVGLLKKPYLHYTRDATEVAYLKALKQVFDPNGILNPGKVFD